MGGRLPHFGGVAFGIMREIHRHMDDEEAERYLMGDSPEEEASDLEEHLLVCAGCREQISNTDAYLSSMSAAAAELRGWPLFDDGKQLSKVLPAFVAMAFLLLVGLLALRFYPH